MTIFTYVCTYIFMYMKISKFYEQIIIKIISLFFLYILDICMHMRVIVIFIFVALILYILLQIHPFMYTKLLWDQIWQPLSEYDYLRIAIVVVVVAAENIPYTILKNIGELTVFGRIKIQVRSVYVDPAAYY